MPLKITLQYTADGIKLYCISIFVLYLLEFQKNLLLLLIFKNLFYQDEIVILMGCEYVFGNPRKFLVQRSSLAPK